MYCKVCKRHPVLAKAYSRNAFLEGCSQLRIEPIRSHANSKAHKDAEYQDRRDQGLPTTVPNPAQEPSDLDKYFSRLTADQQTLYKQLFRTAYYMAKAGRPFSDMAGLLELQQANFGGKIGENYANDTQARVFTMNIANTILTNLKSELLNVKTVSLLADGSTDASVVEQETVFLRFVDTDGQPVTRLLSTVDLENANADGVFAAITSALDNVGLDWDSLADPSKPGPTLVSANFDGASVMQGRKSGTMSKILERVPHIVPMHCVSHKLELAVLDAVKHVSFLQSFEETIKGIFSFYHYSPKKRRELKMISDVLDQDLGHFTAVKQVRWVASKTRAVLAVQKNLGLVVQHLEHVGAGKGEDASRAKGYLKAI